MGKLRGGNFQVVNRQKKLHYLFALSFIAGELQLFEGHAIHSTKKGCK